LQYRGSIAGPRPTGSTPSCWSAGAPSTSASTGSAP